MGESGVCGGGGIRVFLSVYFWVCVSERKYIFVISLDVILSRNRSQLVCE